MVACHMTATHERMPFGSSSMSKGDKQIADLFFILGRNVVPQCLDAVSVSKAV